MLINKGFTRLICFVLFHLGIISSLRGEVGSYKIYISDIQNVVHKNWMGVPRSVDYSVYWEVYQKKDEIWNPADLSVCESFQIYCYQEGEFPDDQSYDHIEGNFFMLNNKQVGVEYGLFIEGYTNGILIASSDTAKMVVGKELRLEGPLAIVQWHQWFPLNGRIPMAIIGRGSVFDNATKAGKIAFHLIWNFLIASVIIMFSCFRYMRLSKIFPLKRHLFIGKGFDDIYSQGVSREFQSIIKEWRDLVENANDHVRQGLEKDNHVQLEDIRMENVRFWREKGAVKIRHLLDRLYKFRNYPIARIIQAGLENHELGGFRWLEVSKEVDRAIENRASSELEYIRRRSHLDWLWNLGTLAPLIGLFGTATGISRAFSSLVYLQADISQSELIQRLSEGIFEALWTTIEGLFVGVLLMLLYYFYNNKLNWIYSKWEEIYVHVSEKL